jgi:hypothetical protein
LLCHPSDSPVTRSRACLRFPERLVTSSAEACAATVAECNHDAEGLFLTALTTLSHIKRARPGRALRIRRSGSRALPPSTLQGAGQICIVTRQGFPLIADALDRLFLGQPCEVNGLLTIARDACSQRGDYRRGSRHRVIAGHRECPAFPDIGGHTLKTTADYHSSQQRSIIVQMPFVHKAVRPGFMALRGGAGRSLLTEIFHNVLALPDILAGMFDMSASNRRLAQVCGRSHAK